MPASLRPKWAPPAPRSPAPEVRVRLFGGVLSLHVLNAMPYAQELKGRGYSFAAYVPQSRDSDRNPDLPIDWRSTWQRSWRLHLREADAPALSREGAYYALRGWPVSGLSNIPPHLRHALRPAGHRRDDAPARSEDGLPAHARRPADDPPYAYLAAYAQPGRPDDLVVHEFTMPQTRDLWIAARNSALVWPTPDQPAWQATWPQLIALWRSRRSQGHTVTVHTITHR
jgi:hypothetical protein